MPSLRLIPEANHWALQSGSKSVEIQVSTRLAVNEPDMLRGMAMAGAGIALLPNIACAEDVVSGRLQRLLPDWVAAETPVHAVYPSSRHHAPKVMAFVELARERWAATLTPMSHG
ncbi:LysR substrate-binding domain-containing protein [Cystobacter fuscus]